jgi:hypothetical protein
MYKKIPSEQNMEEEISLRPGAGGFSLFSKPLPKLSSTDDHRKPTSDNTQVNHKPKEKPPSAPHQFEPLSFPLPTRHTVTFQYQPEFILALRDKATRIPPDMNIIPEIFVNHPAPFKIEDLNSDSFQRRPTTLTRPNSKPASLQRSTHAWIPTTQRLVFESTPSELEKNMIKVQGILNKVTPDNLQALSENMKSLVNSSVEILRESVDLIHEKAIQEKKFVSVYGDLCKDLCQDSVEFVVDSQRISFRGLMITRCQNHFEIEFKPSDQEAVASNSRISPKDSNVEDKSETDGVYAKFRAKKLGNIRFVGELYKRKLIPERIIHACIVSLLVNIKEPKE